MSRPGRIVEAVFQQPANSHRFIAAISELYAVLSSLNRWGGWRLTLIQSVVATIRTLDGKARSSMNTWT